MSRSQTLFQDFQEDCFRCDRQAAAYEAAFARSDDALQIFDCRRQIIDVNPALARLSGFTRQEILTMGFEGLFPKTADYHALLSRDRLVMSCPLFTLTTRMRTATGGQVNVALSISPLYGFHETRPVFQAHIRPCARPESEAGTADADVPPGTEEACRTADRLRAIGALAGGIAHNFNNILTGLYGNITLAKMEIKDQPHAVAHLEKAEQSMDEAVKLTRQLLTFAKGGNPVKETFDPSPLIEETVRFNLSGSMVKAGLEIETGLWPVHGDRDQISQVISNIVINARQAMPEGGRLSVRAKNTTMLKDNLLTIAKGPYIRLVFQDNGPGIVTDDLERIFDPYFSTRPGHKGMGLSICYSIITKHQGHISAASQVGQGTAVSIYLPAVPDTSTKETNMAPQASSSMNQARILVMDDEEHIRSITAKMLDKFGYTVTLTEDGQEAVDAYKTAMDQGNPFSLVIMDLTIPGGMGGQEASGLILEMDPDAVIVVSSGYSNDDVMSDYKAYGLKGIIPKPFRLAELKETIETLLS